MGQYRLAPLDLADGNLAFLTDRPNYSNVIDFEQCRRHLRRP
jgi:Ser/Thr protein kinase RdoA (MazF antagonist)